MRTLLCKNPLGFVIGRKSIEGRFDVNYYKPEYRELIKKLKNSPFDVKILGDIVSLSSERWKKPKSGTFRYIEINDIDTFSAQIIQAKELNVEDAPSRAQMVVRKGDIIVSTTRPYRGAIALVSEEYDGCICSTGFVIIRELKAKINRKYLLYFLHSSFGLKQMEQRMTGGNYPAITSDELLKILVPLPPIDIQNRIVMIMEKALNEKRKMEKIAENLLNSVDNYLMQELGIILPEFEEKSPLIYTIGAKFLRGKRWDIEYWKPEYREIHKQLSKSSFEIVRFGDMIKFIANGFEYRDYDETGIPYLRISDFDEEGNVNMDQVKRINIPPERIPNKIKLKSGDLLITRSGTVGICTVVSKDLENAVISSHLIRVVLKEDISPDYVRVFFNSRFGRTQIKQKIIGQIIGEISQNALKSIKIPLPSRSIQYKIANEVKRRIENAKELQKNGKQIVEKAKEEIEKIILGEKNYEQW